MVGGVPEIRPEGYTEALGDIFITCTGGPVMQVGMPIATTTVIVYVAPAVPITSRFLDSNGASEALLIIDEAGANIPTGATGGYGPQAPQTLCTTAQQQQFPSPCQAYIGTDNSGQYLVSVQQGSSTPAQNVYQGKVGDFGANSVSFYGVPVLPPASAGVSRIFRITNVRIPAPGLSGTIEAFVSTSPNQVLPVNVSEHPVAIIGPGMTANVNTAPNGGNSPFAACVPTTSPALTARVSFLEGFATSFKTRVVPGGASYGMPGSAANTTWAAEAQNLASPSNQNIPGGLYGGFASNSESAFILPAANYTVSGVTYTAGLSDYGTRLKAAFTNIPAGVALYVSTSNAATYTTPGGTNTAPYAVLVASSQSDEANNDGATFTPLTSAIVGSDGLFAYPLTPDASGTAAAIWEVVNSNRAGLDNLTFSVYISYSGMPSVTTFETSNVALSFAPEPGGGTFSPVNGTYGLTSPAPRFAITRSQQNSWVTIDSCSVSAGGASPVSFSYWIDQNSPPSQTRPVTTYPGGLTATATPVVTTPPGGNWLSATVNAGTVTISTNPAGLAASSTAYTGSVTLSVPGANTVSVPVTLTVYPPLTCTITGDQVASVADVQRMINAALGVDPPVNDLNQDGTIGVADVQIVINAALGSGCVF